MISHCAMDEINILWCELIGSEPEGWTMSRVWSKACVLGACVRTLVCDHEVKCFHPVQVLYLWLALQRLMVN